MTDDLNYAILALDAYNRGYDPGIELNGNTVGSFTIVAREVVGIGDPAYAAWELASFYAVAYQDASGNIVISYRGTDDPTFGADLNAWAGGAGWETEQAKLAARFCHRVRQANPEATFTHTARHLH